MTMNQQLKYNHCQTQRKTYGSSAIVFSFGWSLSSSSTNSRVVLPQITVVCG
jgi:hypothetical protein